MDKGQLEAALALVAYLCPGIAYTVWEHRWPSDYVKEAYEELPEFNSLAPGYAHALIKSLWVVMVLLWPWHIAFDLGKWIGRQWKKRKGKDSDA